MLIREYKSEEANFIAESLSEVDHYCKHGMGDKICQFIFYLAWLAVAFFFYYYLLAILRVSLKIDLLQNCMLPAG